MAQQSAPGPLCRASDLHALFRGFRAAGGSLTGAVVMTNAGGHPCWVTGTPRSVALLSDGGDSVSVRSRPLDLPTGGGPVQLAPGAALPGFGAPVPEGAAWFLLTWSNWCADTNPDVSSLLVVLPAGGSVTAPLDSVAPTWGADRSTPKCDDARAGSTVTIGRFQAPGT